MNVEKHSAEDATRGAPEAAVQIGKVALIVSVLRTAGGKRLMAGVEELGETEEVKGGL